MQKIKEEYPEHDVVVMNNFNEILLDLIHPDLVHDFLTAEKLPIYRKTDFETKNMKRVIGEGLTLSEDKVWKMKRKVLN